MIYLISGQKQLENNNEIYQISTVEKCIEYCYSLNYIGLDSETTGFSAYSNKLLTLQLGDSNNQYVIDYSTINIKLFKKLLEEKDIICHNYQFDGRFLYHNRIVPNKVHDTFLAECILQQGLNDEQKNLKAIALKYCNVEIDKSVRGQIHWRGLDSKVIQYAAKDVEFLENIYLKQLDLIEKAGSREQLRLEEEYIKVLTYIAYSGLKLDTEAWKNKCNQDKLNLNNYKEQLDVWAINTNNPKYVDTQLDLFSEEKKCRINWNSQKQVIPIFKELGFDLLVQDKITGKMKYSVEEPVIAKQKHLNPLAEVYLNYKGAEKVVSTYGNTWFDMIDPISKRIHTSFWPIRDTGRLSSGSSKENTPNFQNIPADKTRECFIPEKGNVFIDCDYDSMEVRVFTNLSKEENLINFFKREIPGDMHCETARALFPELKSLSDEEIKKNYKDKRQIGKIASFTLQFGGTGFTIAQNLAFPINLGEKIYNNYMLAYPGIKNYFLKVRKEALQRGYILINDKTGAKCYIHNFKEFKRLQSIPWEEKTKKEKILYSKIKGKIERNASNYPTQGSSAIINKVASIYIFKELQSRNWLFKVLFPNTVHDQNLLECPEDIKNEVRIIVEKCMIEAGNKFCDIIPLTCTAEIKYKWSK